MKKENELKVQEIIDLAYATFNPYLDISSELEILLKSDDGGKHLQFLVKDRQSAKFLRKEMSHAFEGYRTIIIYEIEREEG